MTLWLLLAQAATARPEVASAEGWLVERWTTADGLGALRAGLGPRRRVCHAPPMLELRPNCECCDRDLPPASTEAWICSFECTFCTSCVQGVLAGVCPNCGGGFSPRPPRPARLLERYPASRERVRKDGGC